MAKTSRRRASSIFDSTSMKRFTGFFGGSPASEEVVQEKVQEKVPQTITPPPLPPLNTNIRQQKQRSDSLQTPITALNGTPTSGTTPKATRTFSMPLPSSPQVQDSTPTHPKRVESLSLTPTPAHPPVASGSLSPYLHPSSSPVGSSRTSRNFSGASAMSGMSGMSGISVVSAASYTSYGSSRPTSSQAAQIPMPPSPTTADIPRQLKGKKGRRGIFGRKRKDNVEIPAAWRLAHGSSESLEGYNFGPLTRGGQVPDLWDPTGDTLVFLAPRNAAKSVTPRFRINSGPLMSAALGQYIEDLQFSEGPEDSQDLFLEVPRGVPSAPFKQDNRPGSAPTSSRPGDEDLSGQPGILSQLAQTGDGDSFMDENVAYKVYYPLTDSEPKSSVPMKGKRHKHSNSDPNNDSFQRLIDARNLFAFLNYTFLVSTLHRETPFQIMEKIFKQLQGPHSPELHAEDLNLSRRINAAEGNFLYYVEELKIDDIRNDDDAIIEALIMGERWRCQRLYREGFIHASGRWEDIKDHAALQYISQETKKRLDRASLNLHQIRLYNVTTGLTNFDYPSVWVGDDKYPELKPWKAGFEAMRKITLNFYKNVYGSWPPKPGKHGKGGGYTETGGLNRLVLKRLYDDFCVLYDLLVDREWIHGERIRFDSTYFSEGEEGKEQRTKEESARNALRKIMSTLDNSTVPVQPNIPFDQPRLLHIPTPAPSTEKKKSKKPRSQKRLKSDELAVVLKNSYNADTIERAKQNEFASAYLKLEADFAKGKNLDDIIEARRGRWIFMYCVLQNLPMTVVDAVGCQYGDGVEYFLCENVKGSLPWERSNNRANRMSGIWGVSGPYGGLGPSGSSSNLNGDDEIDYTYRRSHCFDIAEDWRMVQQVPGADDEFEMDGESGNEEFIEYRPLDQPMPDSPKAESPTSPSGLSPAPFRQSYPNSERSQAQSLEINNEGGYVPYHQQGAVQSRENILSETYQPTYRPLTYMPAAPLESERPQSYGSQMSKGSQEGSRVKSLPPLDFESSTPGSRKNSTIVMIPMSPTHHDDSPGTSIESQMDRAFSGQN